MTNSDKGLSIVSKGWNLAIEYAKSQPPGHKIRSFIFFFTGWLENKWITSEQASLLHELLREDSSAIG